MRPLSLVAATTALAALGLLSTLRAGAQGPAAPGITSWTAAEAFAKGPLLLDRMASNQYQVFAVRRGAPGAVEHHALDTDIIMVLDGAATFVTGGVVNEPRQLRANEQTGSGIRDGQARRVARGDVIVVPNGTPHWFSDVSPVIRYYAVKFRQASAEVKVPPRVEYWTGADAFAKSGLLFRGREGPFVEIHTYRRDTPAGSERHDLETELVFMMDSGDALAIPPGTPHSLRELSGPVECFAVKVR